MLKNLDYKIKFYKISFIYIWLLLLFSFSGFYFAKMPILSPVYLILIPSIFFTTFLIFKKNCIKVPLQSVLAMLFVFYIFFSQLIVQGKVIAIFGSMATLLFYVVATLLLPQTTTDQIKKIINYFLSFNVILYMSDTIYRLSLYNFNLHSMITSFYYMKKQCLFYSDTNPLAINTTILTFFSLYLFDKYKEKKYIYFLLINSCITFLTLSRSGIIATLLSLIIYFMYKNIKTNPRMIRFNAIPLKTIRNMVISLIIAAVGLYLSEYIIHYLSDDGSFSSKVSLAKGVTNFFANAPILNLLFGTGYNNGGITIYTGLLYAHSYLATYIIETGICGYILITSFLCSIFLYTPKTAYILIPFIFLGISHISHAQLHCFYAVLALIWYLESYSTKGNNLC